MEVLNEQFTRLCFLILLNIHFCVTLRCLKCDNVISPKHCHNIQVCKANEVCFISKSQNLNQEDLYTVGCTAHSPCSSKHVDTSHCTECCSSDLCNVAGCGEQGYPTRRGPICLNCLQSRNTSTCDQVAGCSENEVCRIEVTEEYGERFYTTSCSSKACTPIQSQPIFGKRSNYRNTMSTVCASCCSSDICNDECITAAAVTTTITTPSNTQTTGMPRHYGKEYWFTFPQDLGIFIGGPWHLNIILTSAGKTGVSVRIYNNTGYSTYNFNSSLVIDVNKNMKLLPNVIEDKGIRITSSDDLVVHGYCHVGGFYPLTFSVTPFENLGTAYMVSSCDLSRSDPSGYDYVSILSTYSDTAITVTLNITGNYTYQNQIYKNGDKFMLNLKQYYSFQLSHQHSLTGTILHSNRPIAVQSGCAHAYYNLHVSVGVLPYSDTMSYETSFSMFVPAIPQIGSTFIVPNFRSAFKTAIKIVPLNRSTSVTVQGHDSTDNYISNGKTLYIDVSTKKPSVVQCSSSCIITMHSFYFDHARSNFLTLLPAMKQYSYNYTYTTPHDVFSNYTHYVIIFVKSSDVGGLSIDNKDIFAFSFSHNSLIVGTDSWTIFDVEVEQGTHSLTTSLINSHFGVVAYGVRNISMYAYPIALKLDN